MEPVEIDTHNSSSSQNVDQPPEAIQNLQGEGRDIHSIAEPHPLFSLHSTERLSCAYKKFTRPLFFFEALH